MPKLTTIEIKNMNEMLVRSLRDHSVVSGIARLHRISVQYDQPIGPNTRFQNMKYSQCDAEYHAMNASMPYPYATMKPVASMTLPMLSMCRSVTSASR